MTIMIVMNVQA